MVLERVEKDWWILAPAAMLVLVMWCRWGLQSVTVSSRMIDDGMAKVRVGRLRPPADLGVRNILWEGLVDVMWYCRRSLGRMDLSLLIHVLRSMPLRRGLYAATDMMSCVYCVTRTSPCRCRLKR